MIPRSDIVNRRLLGRTNNASTLLSKTLKLKYSGGY